MNKKIFYLPFVFLFLLGSVNAYITISSNDLFIDLNKTYPLVLMPLDNNVWNITLNVYTTNWSSFNFTWSGSQYDLAILFSEEGDYPFVINSSEVEGSIAGKFYVREPFNVTFRFYKDKASTIFSSNKYINNFAYLTAEFTGQKTIYSNNYDDNLEPFVAIISDSRFKKPVFYSQYNNGEATLKLYEKDEYALRLIDGNIIFNGVYSVPNVTKSYGTNVYIGKFQLTNSTSYNMILTDKDLNPYGWLFNWIYIILVGLFIVGSVFLFFLIPEYPLISVMFGLGFTAMLTLARIIIWFWKGF